MNCLLMNFSLLLFVWDRVFIAEYIRMIFIFVKCRLVSLSAIFIGHTPSCSLKHNASRILEHVPRYFKVMSSCFCSRKIMSRSKAGIKKPPVNAGNLRKAVEAVLVSSENEIFLRDFNKLKNCNDCFALYFYDILPLNSKVKRVHFKAQEGSFQGTLAYCIMGHMFYLFI